MNSKQAARKGEVIPNLFSYFSTKAYVLGAKKNRLKETALFSTRNICLENKSNLRHKIFNMWSYKQATK